MSFYAKAGDAERVTSLYQSMRQLHLIPNIQILTSVLSAFARYAQLGPWDLSHTLLTFVLLQRGQ